ncbi:MAG TPA: prepilin peptidase [Stellaceae bacterium]|jgi:prepilin peptidase CpaA
MAPGLHLIALLGFALLMAAAAIEDARRLVIPNPLVLALCALWPLGFATGAEASLAAGAVAVTGAAAMFLAGALVFARGLIGGGDVKLLSASVLWAGAERALPLLVLTGLIGGVLAIACLTPLGARVGAWRRRVPDPGAAVAGTWSGAPVPYGVAIAVAALIVTLEPYFA